MPRSRFMPEDFELTPEQREKIKSKYRIDDGEVDRQLECIAEWEFDKPKSDWYRTTLVWIRTSDSRNELRRPRKRTTTLHTPTPADREHDQSAWEKDMERLGVKVLK